MKDNYVVLMMLILCACGVKPFDDLIKRKGNPPKRNTTHEVFYEYLDYLGLDARTPIIFALQKKGTAGTCNTWTNGYKEIQIDPAYWEVSDVNHRLELIAHEVAHCDYNIHDHDNSLLEDGCPASIMHDTNFGGECWDKHEDYYMEIFNV